MLNGESPNVTNKRKLNVSSSRSVRSEDVTQVQQQCFKPLLLFTLMPKQQNKTDLTEQ